MVQNQNWRNLNRRIRLSKPNLQNQNLITLFNKLLDTGFLVQGRYVKQFEREIANYLGAKHAIAVSSGTAALHLSLAALGIGPKDEVIVPAYTFPATVNVVELVGAKPILVDVEMDTYNIKVADIERAISQNTKAIIPVHLFGNPADIKSIMEIAGKYNLWVIEDAAGALGSTYKGGKCGTFGIVGCFSFHPRKIITTGEGGMIVTNDDNLAERLRELRNHGMKTMNSYNDFFMPGFNYRMSEIEAIFGLTQFSKIQEIIDERQKLAKLYTEFLEDIPEITFQKVLRNCMSVWQAFVIRFRDRIIYDILNTLNKAGVEVSVGTYAIHLLKFYREKYGFQPLDYPHATKLYFTNLAIPFYNGITLDEMKNVVNMLRTVIS